MFGLGLGEILLILVLALIFIGPKKLPELAKNLGKGLKEFQKAKQGIMDDIHKDLSDDETSKVPGEEISSKFEDESKVIEIKKETVSDLSKDDSSSNNES